MRLYHALLNDRSLISQKSGGFTLGELTISLFLGSLLVVTAGSIIFSQVRSSGNLIALQILRKEWDRTTHFIESEVALSTQVITNPNNVNLSQCTTTIAASDFRFAFDIRDDLPLAIYFVTTNPAGQNLELRGSKSLYRCGPEINRTGNYTSNSVSDASLLVDGMSNDCQIDTSKIFPANSTGQSLRFELCLQGLTNGRYAQTINTFSRVSQRLLLKPPNQFLCSASSFAAFSSIPGTSGYDNLDESSQNTSILICGNGGGDLITGGSGDDIIEAGSQNTNGSVLKGMSGNDRLVGGDENETLDGGDGDDILISGKGTDTMDGGSGNNQYVLESGTKTITGGDELDIIFLDPLKDDFSGFENCTQASCNLTGSNNGESYTINASGVEVIKFSDGRYNITE